MGYKIGQKIALFVAASHFDGVIDRYKGKIKNATLERMLRFDPHDITDDYMEDFAQKYTKYKPAMIKCFPNSLTAFGKFIKRKGIDLPTVRTISCTGENLYDHQRKLFTDIFGGEVFEKVGTRESGVFACECKMHNGLHVFTEGVLLEIIDKNGEPTKPGEIGKVFITDLFNRAMPLIRYEIGDMAIPSTGRVCECGNQLPLIERLLGRDRDIIVDSYGNPKPGYLFTEVILEMNISAQFQVIQENKEMLNVKIVKNDAENIEINKLKESFQEIIGPLVNIKLEYVNEIARDPSGKYGYVISKINRCSH
jgi:phenylacetate-CoA ligase